MRKNPPLDTDKDGYLINAQFSKWGNENFPGYAKGYNPNATLWLHTTEAKNLDRWLDNFSPKSGYMHFYIGAGANLEFGQNLVFFKYKPTKIFDYTKREDIEDILECAYFKCSFPDDFSDLDFRYTRDTGRPLPLIKEDSRDPANEEIIKSAIVELLSQGYYAYYIDPILRCLLFKGYTSYYEHEEKLSFKLKPDGVNIAIFESDWDNLEIAGFLEFDLDKSIEAIERTGKKQYTYTCPVCESHFSVEDRQALVNDILKSGKVACPSCTYSDVF